YQDQIRRKIVNAGSNDFIECAAVNFITTANGHRHIQRESRSHAATGFVREARPRITAPRILMQTAEQYAGIVPEYRLGAVPVMDIPVNNRNAINSMPSLEVSCCQSNVVVEAEAGRSVSRRMMTRRTH